MSSLLYIFDSDSDLSSWLILDDVVMGGRSNGRLYVNEEGEGVFKGTVSLENNGGFSSAKHQFKKRDVSDFDKVIIKIKGDGKRYQFRVKSDKEDDESYAKYFETNGEWEIIEFEFEELSPTYRGRHLDQPNYPGEQMEEISFMIGNKKKENFKLLLDRIELD